jgi:hypothetical protein
LCKDSTDFQRIFYAIEEVAFRHSQFEYVLPHLVEEVADLVQSNKLDQLSAILVSLCKCVDQQEDSHLISNMAIDIIRNLASTMFKSLSAMSDTLIPDEIIYQMGSISSALTRRLDARYKFNLL